jgi:SPP1 gp7 family putative phage head morphogenesis protein
MLKELRHWRSKVEKRGAGIGFETYALAGHPLDAQIRACLAHGVTPVRVFDAAMRALVDGDVEPLDDLTPSPEAYTAWWKSYDDLQHNLGAAWLDMMGRAFDALPDTFNEEYDPLRLLTKMQKPLIESWIGTPDEPGDLTKLILAGMAAGNTALKRESAARPSKRALTLTPDWELLSTQALAFAQVYGYTLIRGINATTAAQVQQIIADWIMTGESVEALRALLLPVFKNPHRAELIAQTESIRVFNEGAFERWRGVGVTQATWQTVNDAHVCPICQPLHGTVGSVDTGWTHPGGADDAARFAGKTYTASAHPGCRCFRRPKLDSIGAD